LTKAGDQFRQSDVTFWGMAALACGVVAVVSANVSALIPEGTFLSLHVSRLEGSSITGLRQQVAQLSSDAARMRQDTREAQSRLTLSENSSGEMARRVGALEVTLPALLESNTGHGIDRSVTTSAIADDPVRQTIEATGGTVAITQAPLQVAAQTPTQPMPETLPKIAFGIALGSAIGASQAGATWNDLTVKLGDVLTGLTPLMNGGTVQNDGHLIAGPLADVQAAGALCKRLESLAVACLPVPYIGASVTN